MLYDKSMQNFHFSIQTDFRGLKNQDSSSLHQQGHEQHHG